ncbi:MAG: integrase domain-containing protein [Halieaceae bacterium]|jgi:site-specific recombinase XerD|uniref:phage integrase N-terminal domain-containing protein n=1 Tax=Haliea alexandrii TaxID=2448162 RepID=UPI000F0BCE25|nr:phage integrase N-terminal domain-containing protein [Haliea alexandrii]MCR9184759.1 integrase domain-containing protein [Halieaceae bacterium]
MRNLNYQLKQLCQRNHDGGYATRHNRERTLTLIADQLHLLGYRRMSAQSLKPKHVEALVARWQTDGLAIGTIKNRMSALRWWAEKVNKPSVIAQSNEHYGIPDRQLVTGVSKAQQLGSEALERVRDTHVRMSLELQRAFGLRREEAIKFQPHYADRGDHLLLKASWTKGGKARMIPVRTPAQRELLTRAHQLTGRGSLIPLDRDYRRQLRVYERHTANAGLTRMHGLRHAYAQERYATLTGRLAPAAGGPAVATLPLAERQRDQQVRQQISRELGHERVQILSVYLS